MRAREAGVILINVLVALALGAAIVVLMFTSQENLMDRTRRAAAATQAEALALGAEASLVAALRRDMEVAPETDHMAEPWALAAQEEVQLETGSFSITVNDAQARFDGTWRKSKRWTPRPAPRWHPMSACCRSPGM